VKESRELLDELVEPYEPNMFLVRRVLVGLDDVGCLVKGRVDPGLSVLKLMMLLMM
jgi:hypothetical protein